MYAMINVPMCILCSGNGTSCSVTRNTEEECPHVFRAMPLGREVAVVPLVETVVPVRLIGMPPDPLVDGEIPLRVPVVDAA